MSGKTEKYIWAPANMFSFVIRLKQSTSEQIKWYWHCIFQGMFIWYFSYSHDQAYYKQHDVTSFPGKATMRTIKLLQMQPEKLDSANEWWSDKSEPNNFQRNQFSEPEMEPS